MIIKSLIKYFCFWTVILMPYLSQHSVFALEECPIEEAAIHLKRKKKLHLQKIERQLHTLRDLKRYYASKRAQLREKIAMLTDKGLKMDEGKNDKLLEDYDSILGIIQREIFQLEVQIEAAQRMKELPI